MKVMLISVCLKPVWQACDLPLVGSGDWPIILWDAQNTRTGWEIMGMGEAVTLKGELDFLRQSSNRSQAANKGGAPCWS